jgi:hypothetical protein
MYICKIYLDRSDGLNEDRSEKIIQQSNTLIEKFYTQTTLIKEQRE